MGYTSHTHIIRGTGTFIDANTELSNAKVHEMGEHEQWAQK